MTLRPRLRVSLFPHEPGGPTDAVGLGWLPDIPDERDFTLTHGLVRERLGTLDTQSKNLLSGDAPLPTRQDLRRGNEVHNQQSLGSCTAQAVVSLVEYLLREKSQSTHFDFSRLFLYKVTRKLLNWTGDRGAYVRETIKAMALFGVPPERYWPYVIDRFDDEPEAFLYSFAQNFKALEYVRLDAPGIPAADVLVHVKRVLAARFPVVFGFPVYSSLSEAADIPVRQPGDVLRGGHCVLAVGYDDEHRTASGAAVPSLIIQNSWGTEWGDGGFGYLPYEYVLRSLALDFWTILKQDWAPLLAFD
jgi:C1A family cysteine protease